MAVDILMFSQVFKSKIIFTILIVILSQCQSETLQKRSLDGNADLVEMKDFQDILLAFAKLTEEFTKNSAEVKDLKKDFTRNSDELMDLNVELNNLKKQVADEPDLDEILEKLKQLSRIGTLRSCEEYAAFGIRTSGMFPIDPDGILVGHPPFSAYCRFDNNTGQVVTEVMHSYSENLTNVDHCADPGCYSRNLMYVSGDDGHHIETSQLQALVELSSNCEQTFYYECTLAPLRNQDVDYAYWIGLDGKKNIYFTGSDSSMHSCDCYYTEEGCEAHDVLNTKCNCDSNEPTPLFDTGVLTKSSSLPILSIAFGGLNFEIQYASYRIGRLVCNGKNEIEIGTSCW